MLLGEFRFDWNFPGSELTVVLGSHWATKAGAGKVSINC